MIRIEVTGDTAEEVLAQLRALAVVDRIADAAVRKEIRAASESTVPEISEGKPSRKPKAAVGNAGETPPATAEEAAPKPETATEVASPSELSFDTDVAPVVLRKVQTAGKPAVEAVLSEFGVDRASQLEAARWPELLEKLEDLG